MLEAMKKNGQPVKALENRPKLSAWLQWIVGQFFELSVDRRQGVEGYPLPLTTSEIKIYFDAFNYGKRLSFQGFFDHIRLVDRIWLERTIEQMTAKRKAAAKR